MKKKILCLMIVSSIIFSLLSPICTGASGYSYYNGFEYYLDNDVYADAEATIVSYKGSSTSVSVPSSIGGHPVTCVMNSVFRDNETITSITFPSTITSLPSLMYCTNLKNVTINGKVKTIDNSTFYGCWNLQSVSFSYPNDLENIGDSAFYSCEKLTSFNCGKNLKKIGAKAFYNCANLTTIKLGNSITSIGSGAFSNCAKLTNVYIDSLEAWLKIPFSSSTNNPMYYAANIYVNGSVPTDITIPDSISSIKSYAFYNWKNLKTLRLGSGIRSIGSNVFTNCTALEKVYVGSIANWLNIQFASNQSNPMYYAANIYVNGSVPTDITIPNSISNINDYAFYNWKNLKTLRLGSGIRSIGSNVFTNCTTLENVYVGSIANWLNIQFASNQSNPMYYAANIYVNGSVPTDITIPNSISNINDYAFYNWKNLKTLRLGSGLCGIGSNVFTNCTALENVYVGSIANWLNIQFASKQSNPMYYAANIYVNGSVPTDITIPDSISSINSYAFYNWSKLEGLSIDNKIENIGYNAFNGCTKLKTIIFNGTRLEFDKIKIESGNTPFTDAYVDILKVNFKLYDDKNNILCDINQEKGTFPDLQDVIKDGYVYNYYTNIQKTESFKIETKLEEDTIAYVDLENAVKLNSVKLRDVTGALNAKSNILLQLATDKPANALIAEIKFSDTLSLKSVTAKDFAYAELEDEYTEYGFTTAVILAQYSETELIPKNEVLTPFELTFDVSKTATPGNIQIEATEESCLIGNETYFFEDRIAGNLEILPKLAEGIEISGADVISSTTTYTAIVTPDYTTDKSVEWSVDNESIATVDENGVVTPVTSGDVTLTATTKDGSNIFATKTITVTRGIESIEIIGADSITEATTYMANILPDYATNKEVEWSISNTEIATIDQNGLVTPVTSGLITITATAKDGSGVSATKEINIIKLAETIKITGEESISSPAQYTAIVSPDYTSDKDVSWSIDNEEIATVDELGIVTPVTSGTVILTAAAKDGSGAFATKTIEIVKFAESIEIVGSEEITEPSQYSVVILPEYTTNKDAEWSVSDETIATVDENGVVTPLKNGKIVLTAKALDASGIETTMSIVITVSVRANSITSDIGIWDKDFDSDITEYTITVSSETSVVYLTSNTTDATIKLNGETALNGVRKKVDLPTKETKVEILLTPTSGNTLKTNTYTIRVLRGSFTKTTVTDDGKSFTISPINIENGKTVILALFSEEQFVELQSAVYNGEAVPFTTTKDYTNAKVMVWNDLTNLIPLCNPEEIKTITK